jgi:desulfoferrodoxin-like iron-binding protein
VDATAPTEEERIHIPVLSLPRAARPGRPFDLVVRIGLVAHPMDAEHRIDWIEVRVGEERAWVIDLGTAVPYPVVRVPIVLAAAGTITVRARCTRHHVWRTRHDVTV